MKALARAISPRCSNRWKWTRFAAEPSRSKRTLDPFTVRPELVEGPFFLLEEEKNGASTSSARTELGNMTSQSPIKLGGVHHAAYRCRDAKETVDWYEAMLGMTYTTAFAAEHVPSPGVYAPYLHPFLIPGPAIASTRGGDGV